MAKNIEDILDQIGKIKLESDNSHDLYYGTLNNTGPDSLKKYCYFEILKKKFPASEKEINSFFTSEQHDLFNKIYLLRKNDTKFNEEFTNRFLKASFFSTLKGFFKSLSEFIKTFSDYPDVAT